MAIGLDDVFNCKSVMSFNGVSRYHSRVEVLMIVYVLSPFMDLFEITPIGYRESENSLLLYQLENSIVSCCVFLDSVGLQKVYTKRC